ncbi:MAG TPA: 4-alpha-glucanotransferase [Ktedonobacterales bacterium]
MTITWSRAGGVLAHPTSLPGPHGVGDLGPGADQFFDFLATAGQTLWQTLPLGPTGYGNSPYAALSAFAGNPALVSPERMIDDGLLTPEEIAAAPSFPQRRVDYDAATTWKMRLLSSACARFFEQPEHPLRAEFDAFCAANDSWLEDFALFMALKGAHGQRAWVEWPRRYAQRQPQALAEARRTLADTISLHRFVQFLFFRQWARARADAARRGIRIIGDLAIFVAHDSADVWSHRNYFSLDNDGQPTVVAGVPPDYFSLTGQRWGNPLYRWDAMAASGFQWWIERVRQALKVYDIIRLDHFRGFESYWEIPGAAPDAVQGSWQPGPGAPLFTAIREALGEVPFIAEDLGVITPEVRALQRELGFPGMRILQFAFGGSARNRDLPHNYTSHSVVYTGTHDNDTTRGWFEARTGHEREYALQYLSCEPDDVTWAMIRAAYASVARLALVPLQDVLNESSEGRMNYPSRADGNWEWRYVEADLTFSQAQRLRALTELYGRDSRSAGA